MNFHYKLITAYFLLLSCDGVNTATPQASSSVDDSKARGVFICNLVMNKDSVNLDSNPIRIADIWVENAWYHTHEPGKVKIAASKQIVVKLTNEKHLNTFGIDWGLGTSSSKYGLSNGNICIDVEGDAKDSYKLYLYKYQEEYSSNLTNIVDSISVQKDF